MLPDERWHMVEHGTMRRATEDTQLVEFDEAQDGMDLILRVPVDQIIAIKYRVRKP